MLRKFKISIDGKEYLVEMEEIGGVPQPAPVAPQPTAPVATTETPAPAVEEAPAPAQPAAPAEQMQCAPMPNCVKVLVNVGDTVSENQPLLILEAMKMENEIVAGKVR